MVVILAVLAALGAGTLVIHMVKPRDDLAVSSARFFTPVQSQLQNQFRVSLIPLSVPFILRSGLLACLFFAFQPDLGGTPHGTTTAVNLWVILDTSGSMSTVQGGESRMAAAIREAQAVIHTATVAAGDKPLCIQLSGFDMELYPAQARQYHSESLAVNALVDFTVRPLGTEIGTVLQAVQAPLATDDPATCPATHIVVITDIPTPVSGLTRGDGIQVIWRDIAQVVGNVGFTQLNADRDPLSGAVREVTIRIQAYGPPSDAQLIITNSQGRSVNNFQSAWSGTSWITKWQPPEPGLYDLAINPSDAYGLDNHAAVRIEAAAPIAVACDLADCSFVDQLGWRGSGLAPQLRLTNRLDEESTIPSLIIGAGYRPASEAATPIISFSEGHPLLSDLNLDVVETLGISGVEGSTLPQGFAPVLVGQNGVWAAVRETPPAVLMPGLPVLSEGNASDARNWANASLTFFFNAVRWLVQAQPLPPLFKLTSPAAPLVKDDRIALFEGEGDTTQAPASLGDAREITPQAIERSEPSWPVWLALAALLFTCERILATIHDRWK